MNLDWMDEITWGIRWFVLGGIFMAYIANYNRDRIPIALLMLLASVLFNIVNNKK